MFETGIPNLDRILGGGIPQGDVLLVVGPAGSGKTTLRLQTAFRAAAGGQPVVCASTLSETPSRLLKHTRGFSFYDERLLGRQLFLLSIYPLVEQALEDVGKALVEAVKEHGARLLVLDGLMTPRELHPDAPALRTSLYDLAATLATLDCTTVITSTATAASTRHELSEFTMADGIVESGREDVGARAVRTIRVTKMRGRGYMTLLVNLLRAAGVTSFLTVETPPIVGPEMDFSHTTMAVLSENLLMFRNVAFRGKLIGIVSIVKMRDSAYDSSIRQYTTTGQGIHGVPREAMAEGVLAAIARLPGVAGGPGRAGERERE